MEKDLKEIIDCIIQKMSNYQIQCNCCGFSEDVGD